MLDVGQNKLLVFISHASEDDVAARRLSKRLKEDGFEPWLDLDRLLPGQDWNFEIEQALCGNDAIRLCFSDVAVIKEGYIQRECKRTMKYLEEEPEKPFPLQRHPFPRPVSALPGIFPCWRQTPTAISICHGLVCQRCLSGLG